MISKSQIRKEIKEKLNRQNDAQRLRKSHLIQKQLFKLAEFKRAQVVMFYIATKREVQTISMIPQAQKKGKKILVPTILVGERRMIASLIPPLQASAGLIKDLKTRLCKGPYGIMQPKRKYIREVPQKLIDLVVVPGLAFNRQGQRLGRGRGYYDRFLANIPNSTTLIGLAFDFQLLKCLPVHSHDVPVTRVISA